MKISSSELRYVNNHRFVGGMHDFYNCEECLRPAILFSENERNMYLVVCSLDTSKIHVIANKHCKHYSERETGYIMSERQAKKFISEISSQDIQPAFHNSEMANIFTKGS